MDDRDPLRGHAPRHEVVARALTDHLERRPTVAPGDRALREPDDRRHRPGRFLERGGPEQVRNEHTEWTIGQPCQEQGQLVDVFHHDIGGLRRQGPAHRAPCREGEGVPAGDAGDRDTVDGLGGCAAGPARTDQPYPVPAGGDSTEDLEEVNLRTAGLRVEAIEPVDEEEVHRRPSEWAIRSSTPLTKAGVFAPPNHWLRRIASSITTFGGVSPISNS